MEDEKTAEIERLKKIIVQLENAFEKTCGDCKFYAQGEGCSFCEHEKQTKEDRKEYLYYNFSACGLYEKGTSQSRIDFMNKMIGIKKEAI